MSTQNQDTVETLQLRIRELEVQMQTLTAQVAALRRDSHSQSNKTANEPIADFLVWLTEAPKTRSVNKNYLPTIRFDVEGLSSSEEVSHCLARHSALHERLTRVWDFQESQHRTTYPKDYFGALQMLLEWISVAIRKKATDNALEQGTVNKP